MKHTTHYKTVTNLIMGPLKSHLNEYSITVQDLEINKKHMAELANMIQQNQVSHIIVSQKLFSKMIQTGESPNKIANQNGWIQQDDNKTIESLVDKVINKYPEKVDAYQNGNTNLLGLFMGEIMRETKGQFNPKAINEILKSKLAKS